MADAAEQTRDDIRVECAETSPVVRSVNVEVDARSVQQAFDRAYGELRRSARVKGFRPGKVPRSVLERMYGAGMPEEVERALVADTLAAAIGQAEVTPISEPDIDAEPPQPGQAFRYTARVEVKPEITLPDDLSAVSSLKDDDQAGSNSRKRKPHPLSPIPSAPVVESDDEEPVEPSPKKKKTPKKSPPKRKSLGRAAKKSS